MDHIMRHLIVTPSGNQWPVAFETDIIIWKFHVNWLQPRPHSLPPGCHGNQLGSSWYVISDVITKWHPLTAVELNGIIAIY